MNNEQIKTWIIENLKGNACNLNSADTSISAIWSTIPAVDGKVYEANIQYISNNKKHATIVATHSNLEDSINFRKEENPEKEEFHYNKEKLNKLTQEIEQYLEKGGDYKLELVGNTDFKIIPLQK